MQSSNKTGILAVIAALVVLGAGVGVFALTRDSGEDTSTNSITNETAKDQADPASSSELANIVGLAGGSEDLTTLVTALKAADLVATLNGDGPFTVFAPTNDAFAKLPAGTVDTLLKPESKTTLSSILTYHVVAGKVMSSDLSNGQIVKTVQGNSLTVEITDGKVMLVDAKGGKSMVTTPDLGASNGVVHLIDTVVMPQ